MDGRALAWSIARGLGVLALGLAVILAILLVAPGLVGAEGTYVVESDSMSPAIAAGDLVVTSAGDADALEVGTVITFQATGTGNRVTHRIVAVEEADGEPRYVTKGDANDEPDPELVAPAQVEGRVWFTVPLVGYLVAFAGTDLGLVVLVVLPALVLVGSEIYSLYRETEAAEAADGDGGSEP